jgi:hypothetical protein
METSRNLLRATYGSRLFGTFTEASDYDFKVIFVDDLRTLVTNHKETRQEVGTLNGVKAETEHNHVQKFGKLLAAQQTFAVELLFLPKNCILTTSPEWEELMAHREKLVSSHVLPFLGFAVSQSKRYGLKGERLDTLLYFDEMVQAYAASLKQHETSQPVSPEFFNRLVASLEGRQGYSIWEDVKGDTVVRYITVGGKSYGETVPLKLWMDPLNRSIASYGKRAYDAKDAQGVDTKAISHAVRVANQAIELLQTGNITFPRPEAEHLKDIRFGRVSHSDASDELLAKIAQAESLVDLSSLPPQPDKDFIREWADEVQINAIKHEINAHKVDPLG